MISKSRQHRKRSQAEPPAPRASAPGRGRTGSFGPRAAAHAVVKKRERGAAESGGLINTADFAAEGQSRTDVTINGRTLTLSNLGKVLYPKAGFTKSQVIDYYARVARFLLPHLHDRPLTLKRYPDGVEGFYFYEKRCPSFRPDWLKTAPIWSERKKEKISFCLANDLPSLIWAANLADLELHTSLARYQQPGRPTVLVFDLDPGPGVDVFDCAEVALWLRAFLLKRRLESFPKTSGSKGLQVYAPLNTPATFEQTKAFARHVADQLTSAHPERVIQRMEKRLRTDRIFIDWSQNDSHKTTICVYSLRAMERPTVSTPLTWDEVSIAASRPSGSRPSFETEQVLQRIETMGDLFEPVLKMKQKLPPSL